MDITMPRGDLRSVSFTVQSPDSSDYVTNLDEVFFTVKKNYNDRHYILQKRLSTGAIILNNNGSYQFSIYPTDTDKLLFGEYVFDIEVVRRNDIKQTFAGKLKLLEEVTYSENER